MRERLKVCLALAVALPLSVLSVAAQAAADSAPPLLIRNVTVLTMTGKGAIEDGAVLVRDGRIEAVGPAGQVAAPDTARVLDGQGLFLTPGLVDAHVHLDHPSVLPLFPDHGITTVLNMRGFPEVLRWRREVAAGKRIGPQIYTAGDIIESAPGTWAGFSIAGSEEQARALVRLHARAGYDFIKVYHGISADHLRAIVSEARKAGLSVIGHAPQGVSIRKASRLGLVDFAHGMELLRGYESSDEAARDARRIARRIKRSDAWVTPNLVYLDTLARQQARPSLILENPNYARLHPAMRQWFDPVHNPYAAQGESTGKWNAGRLAAVRVLTRELHREGVPLLAGSDALAAGIFPQIALFDEFRLLHEAGLSPADILTIATAGAGQFIRTHIDRKAMLGMIAPGARADLVLAGHDPRRKVLSVDSVRGVVAAGRVHGSWGGAASGARPRRISSATSAGSLDRDDLARTVIRLASLVRAGKLHEARSVYDAARAARPGEVLFHRFAWLNFVRPLLIDDGKFVTDPAKLEKAVIAYQIYTDTYPGLHLGHIRLAQAYAGLKRCAEARAELERARTLSPGHPLIARTAALCGR